MIAPPPVADPVEASIARAKSLVMTDLLHAPLSSIAAAGPITPDILPLKQVQSRSVIRMIDVDENDGPFDMAAIRDLARAGRYHEFPEPLKPHQPVGGAQFRMNLNVRPKEAGGFTIVKVFEFGHQVATDEARKLCKGEPMEMMYINTNVVLSTKTWWYLFENLGGFTLH